MSGGSKAPRILGIEEVFKTGETRYIGYTVGILGGAGGRLIGGAGGIGGKRRNGELRKKGQCNI